LRGLAGLLAGLSVVTVGVLFVLGSSEPEPDGEPSAKSIAHVLRDSLPESSSERPLLEFGPESQADLEPLVRATLRPVILTGRIVDSGGTPVAGARVGIGSALRRSTWISAAREALSEASMPVRSRRDGRFELVRPGDGRQLLLVALPGGPLTTCGEIYVVPGVEVAVGDIEVPAPKPVAGRVVDEDGSPLPGAEIFAVDSRILGCTT
jgi:hypothetical protein